MEKMKRFGLLLVGLVLSIAGLIVVLTTKDTSYKASKELKTQISEVKDEISKVEKGEATGDIAALKSQKATLEEEKLSLERPYSYGLTLLFFSLALTLLGLYKAVNGYRGAAGMDVNHLAMAGLMAALCYIGFAFFKIDIPVGTEKTAFHFGNVFCVLAALLLGGFWGGMAGAIGMTIGDLTTSYVTSAPKTFLLKLMIGLIVGLVAHRIFKLSKAHSPQYVTAVTIGASACGMLFNVVADPLVGYFYKMYLLGVPQELSAALAKMGAITTFVNAIVAVVAASFFYLALRPALKKSGLFVDVTPDAVK